MLGLEGPFFCCLVAKPPCSGRHAVGPKRWALGVLGFRGLGFKGLGVEGFRV